MASKVQVKHPLKVVYACGNGMAGTFPSMRFAPMGVEAITVNGVGVHLDDGSWVLVRASSNKPGLVVVESVRSEDDMRDLFHKTIKPRLSAYPEIGASNQEI